MKDELQPDADELLEEVIAEAADPSLQVNPLAAAPTDSRPSALAFNDLSGEPYAAVPQTAEELSLLERFAQYDREVIGRLLAFESRRRELDAYLSAIDAPADARPDHYDEYLKKLMRRI